MSKDREWVEKCVLVRLSDDSDFETITQRLRDLADGIDGIASVSYVDMSDAGASECFECNGSGYEDEGEGDKFECGYCSGKGSVSFIGTRLTEQLHDKYAVVAGIIEDSMEKICEAVLEIDGGTTGDRCSECKSKKVGESRIRIIGGD